MKPVGVYIKIYGIALAAFLLIDAVWIGFAARDFYADRLAHLLTDAPNVAAAVLFYLMFVAGLVYFGVLPALKSRDTAKGIINSGVFGLMTYGTYDLTNLALMKDWPISVTVVDMVWGVAVSLMVGWITIKLGRHLVGQED